MEKHYLQGVATYSYRYRAMNIVCGSFFFLLNINSLLIKSGEELASSVWNGNYEPKKPVDAPNPAIFVEFSTAALRVGHTLIKSYYR